MPPRALLSALSRVTSTPLNRSPPLRAGKRPITVFINVLLPTPLRPSTPTTSPGATARVTPCSTSPVAKPACSFSTSRTTVMSGPPKIDFPHFIMCGNFVNGALGENAALVKHRYLSRHLAHKGDVVFDYYNGQAGLIEMAKHASCFEGFFRRQPRCWFIEQQNIRAARQNHGDFKPLELVM